jgi:hypothetical protein
VRANIHGAAGEVTVELLDDKISGLTVDPTDLKLASRSVARECSRSSIGYVAERCRTVGHARAPSLGVRLTYE